MLWFRGDDRTPNISDYPTEGRSAIRCGFPIWALDIASTGSFVPWGMWQGHTQKGGGSRRQHSFQHLEMDYINWLWCLFSTKTNIVDVQNPDQMWPLCLSRSSGYNAQINSKGIKIYFTTRVNILIILITKVHYFSNYEKNGCCIYLNDMCCLFKFLPIIHPILLILPLLWALNSKGCCTKI